MAALDFRNLVINSLLLGLFIFGIFVFSFTMAFENGLDPVLLQDELVNRTFANLSTTLIGGQGSAEDQRTNFESEIPTVGTDSFLFESVISSGKTFSSAMSVVGNIAISFVIRSLGLNEGNGFVIFSVFITIIVILIILLAWKIYKTGF